MDRITDIIQRLNENTSSNQDVPSWYSDKNKFLHYKLGAYILENCHIIRLDNKLYIYDKDTGIYTSDTDVFENTILDFQDTLVNRQIDEVMGYIRRRSIKTNTEIAPPRYFAFNNRYIRY